jgi:hypothetical protein
MTHERLQGGCGRHGHGRRRFGRREGFGPRGRFSTREEWLAHLEEYQKDLEQRIADVADIISRLRHEPADTSTV